MGLFDASYQMTLQFQSLCPPGMFLPLFAVFWLPHLLPKFQDETRRSSERLVMEGGHSVSAACQWSLSRGSLCWVFTRLFCFGLKATTSICKALEVILGPYISKGGG